MLRELLLDKWAQVRAGFLETVEKFTDADLPHRAIEGGYSIAELMLHVAHEEEIEVRWGVMRELDTMPPAFNAADYASVASIVGQLAETHARTVAYLKRLSDDDLLAEAETPWGSRARRIDLLWHVLEHEIHHRGELSLILGLLGRPGLDA